MIIDRKRGLVIFSFTLILLLIQFSSAEIFIGQTEGVYSVGDDLYLEIKVESSSSVDDFLTALLKCKGEEEILLRMPLSVRAGQEKQIDNNISLTKSFLGNIMGECVIEATFFDEKEQSQFFEISDFVDVELSVSKTEIEPGDNVVVTGDAKKKNLEPVEGFVEINVPEIGVNLKDQVKKGRFVSNFTFPESAVSGKYELKARVYEKDKKGQISNEGSSSMNIGIKQVPTKLEIAINEQGVQPGGNLTFKVFIYDQVNEEVDGDVSVVVYDSFEEIIWKRLVKTNQLVSINVDTNSSPGYWQIEASKNDLNVKRLFYLEENEEAEFKLINDTLLITNIGNVPYRKAVQIAIGNEVEIKQMDLFVGESKKFRLLAPDGDYKISVTDGTNSFSRGNVALTGNVIGVMDVRKQVSMINRYPIVWLFLIVVMGLFLVTLVQKFGKRQLSVYAPSFLKKKVENKVEIIKRKNENNDIEAEKTLVPQGNKEEASVIALRVNSDKLSQESEKQIKSLIGNFKQKKAAVLKSGDIYLIIFTPTLTKTFDNPVIAAESALKIKQSIEKYNSSSQNKIDFGIGIHSGNVIAKIDEGKLKFTSLGDTLSRSRNFSGISEKDILLSPEFYRKNISKIKGEKIMKKEKEAYRLNHLSVREKYEEFIKDFKEKYGN
jgi:hypothetical protein